MSATALSSALDHVRGRLAGACERVGRDPASVTLVAVTKTVPVERVIELHALGVRDFGENRPATLLEKRAAFEAHVGPEAAAAARWHMIGHLQRNKARRLLPGADLIHSGDSLRLLDSLDSEAGRTGRRLPILLQVNVAGETQKGGFPPEQFEAAARHAGGLPHLEVRGLMCMAPEGVDESKLRTVFSLLKEMRDEAASRGYLGGRELSMGMSGDYEIAAEHGATLVRVGRALFTDR